MEFQILLLNFDWPISKYFLNSQTTHSFEVTSLSDPCLASSCYKLLNRICLRKESPSFYTLSRLLHLGNLRSCNLGLVSFDLALHRLEAIVVDRKFLNSFQGSFKLPCLPPSSSS